MGNKVIVLFLLLLPVFMASCIWSQDKPSPAENPNQKAVDQMRQLMRSRDYKQTITLADEILGRNPADKDYFLYMKCLAQFYSGTFAEAEAGLKTIVEMKESVWYHKAQFLLGRIYLKNKDFASLEKIYAQEAQRLHAESRKEQIAKIYVQFADALCKEPSPEDLQAPPPDFSKAHTLYKKALELKPNKVLIEDLMFRLGEIMVSAKVWQTAGENFQRYLETYDPSWFGLPDEPLARRSPVSEKGKYCEKARYLLAQCYIEQSQGAIARRILEDLSGILQTKKDKDSIELFENSLWQILKSYQSSGISDADVPVVVQSLKTYLKEFPEGKYSVLAAAGIAAVYMEHNRTDEAISSWKDFLAGKGYKVLANVTAKPGEETPLQTYEKLRKEGTYYLGKLYAEQKSYEQAIQMWQQYIAQFPDGANWSESQQGILDAEYQIGEDLIASQKYAEARTVWEKFMARYPLDVRTCKILYTLGSIQYQLGIEAKTKANGTKAEDQAKAIELCKQYMTKAIAEWEKLTSKYPNAEETQCALYMSGTIYEEYLSDLKKALEFYRKVTGGKYYYTARDRITRMTAKHLALSTERVYRTNETPKIKVHTRNIKKLSLRAYKLNLEEYFRKEHTIQEIEKLDLSLIEPDKLWEVPVEQYSDYLPIEQDIPIPMQEAGVYAVHVGDDELEGTTLVLCSDLEFIVKSSYKEVLVYVQNMREIKPESNVKILLSDGVKIIKEGVTGQDGVFLHKLDGKEIGKISAFVVKNGNVASNLVSLSGLAFSLGLSSKGYIFTERPVYQPGEKVQIRAILRDVAEGSYIVPTANAYKISIYDPQGRCLLTEDAKLSGFGSMYTSFILSEQTSVGDYRISLVNPDNKQQFDGQFKVAHFQVPKVSLTLTFPHRVYFRGEKITAKFQAGYYYGTPISGKPLRYTLPDQRSFVANTDEKGILEIEFDTKQMKPGTSLSFTGNLEAENVSVTENVFLAEQGFSIQVSSLRSIVLAGEPVEISVKTNDASSKPIGVDMVLGIYRIVSVKPDPVLASLPWKEISPSKESEVKVEEKKFSTDANGQAKVSVSMEKGGNYILRVSGQDRFNNPVEGKGTLFVSDQEDSTKLRIFSNKQHLKQGETAEISIHSRLENGLALITMEGDAILGYKILPISSGFNPWKIDIDHTHFPNFHLSVATISGNRFYQAEQNFTVEREMKVLVEWPKKEFNPGEKAQVTITATDQQNNPVEAEISLALVEEALFSVYSESRSPIVEFLQKGIERTAPMRTQTSCIFEYKATIKKVDKAVLNEIKKLEELQQKQIMAELAPNAPAYEAKAPMRPKKAYKNGHAQAAGRLSGKKITREKDRLAARTESENGGEAEELDEDETSADTGAAMPAVEARQEKPGIGWWNPSVVTDKNGKATVEISMPEKITKWRLTAIGCTVKTLVGEAKDNCVTTKKFFVDLKLPSMMREGDTVKVLARVHNLTDYAGSASITLEIWSTDMKAPVQPKHVMIEAGKTTEFIFDEVDIPSILECQVKVTAEVPAKGLKDAVVHTIPIQPWGMEYTSDKSGKAKSSTTVFLELPKGNRYSSHWMTIVIGPSMSKTILDLAMGDDLQIQRYASSSKAMYHPFSSQASELLCAASALEYASKTYTTPGDFQKLQTRCKTIVASLISMQKGNGGWGVTHQDSYSNIVVTARTLWALSCAKNQGIQVEDKSFSKAIQYLKSSFKELQADDNETKALVQYALAMAKEGKFEYANRLHRERMSMNPAGLAYTALLLMALEKKEMAEEVLSSLDRHKIGLPNQMWKYEPNSSWTRSNTETTALVVLALATVNPQSPLLEKAVDHLLSLRCGYSFYPYHAKGTVVAALSRYFMQAMYDKNNYKLSIQVNGKPFQTIEGRDETPMSVLNVPMAMIAKTGVNKVDFQFEGNGVYSYSATLKGFSSRIYDPKSWSHPFVSSRTYYHAPLEYKGKPIGVSSSSVVQNLEQGQKAYVYVNFSSGSDSRNSRYFVIEEPLPAGAVVVKDSVQGTFSHYEIQPGRMVFYLTPQNYVSSISYQIAGYAPGSYRVLPTVIRDAHNPSSMRVGAEARISVLSPGEKSKDSYAMNHGELYEMGRLYFEDGDYSKSLTYLSKLASEDLSYNIKDVTRMLLWIYTEKGFYDAQKIVNSFEILKEKYPELYIPFERILIVGQAYEDMKEYERAYLVYQATLEASFEEEAKVGGVLEDQGQFLGSVEYMRKLWQEYHDSASVSQAYFGVSQALYSKISRLEELKNNYRLKKQQRVSAPPTKEEILRETIDILEEFLSMYPEIPQAADAAFSLASTYLSLDKFNEVITLSAQSRELYKNSNFVSSFQYMEALGYFSLYEYEKAIEQAKSVAEGSSKDKDYATYILGQIYHAQGNPMSAIQFYRRIQDKFPDAKDSITYFERRYIRLPEITKVLPSETPSFELEYCNIKKVQFLVYRVDLMKLYLQQKSLSGITKVHLAGISPVIPSQELSLDEGKEYQELKKKITLSLNGEGAYLVICRGDDLFASGLILITPLQIDIQEDVANGMVRINAFDTVKKIRPKGVHIKVVGSSSNEFISGETDLRGVFAAEGIRGKVTVIARDKKNLYAFYRGETWIGHPATPTPTPVQQMEEYDQRPAVQMPQRLQKYDFRSNLEESNRAMQETNVKRLYEQMRSNKEGVQVDMAK